MVGVMIGSIVFGEMSDRFVYRNIDLNKFTCDYVNVYFIFWNKIKETLLKLFKFRVRYMFSIWNFVIFQKIQRYTGCFI